MIGLGIGINYSRVIGSIDTQAQAHYDRVIADGGIMPAGLLGCNAWFVAVKAVYAVTDITTAISAGYDPHYLGAKIGAGSGTTLGQAATKLYSCSGASGDLTQATAASMPLLLAHSGVNYWFSPAVNNNNCSTTSVSVNTASGMSVETQLSFTINDDASNVGGWICSNDDSGINRNMFLGFSGTRTLIVYWANLTRSATATAQIPAAYNGWLKASLETSGSDMLAKFWTSSDGVTWTQLGATITNVGGANTFQTSASPFYVTGNVTSNNIAGKIYRVIYRNASGTARADFNPASYNAATSQTSWVSATSETWNINVGTATTGYKGVLVDRTIMQGDGVDDVMNSTLSGSGRFTQYLAASPYGSITGNEAIAGPWNGANWRGAIYTNSSKYATYQGAGADGVFGSAITKGQLIQVGVVNSSTGTDWQPFVNGADVSNGGFNIGSQNVYTSVNIFARSGGVTFSNSKVNTYILTAQADNSTQRTAMYNLIRVLNNSSF